MEIAPYQPVEHLVKDPFHLGRFGTLDNAINHVLLATRTPAQVRALERKILALEQAEMPVIHRFSPGLYIREISMPAGTVAIGHRQKTEHLNVLLKGRVRMVNANGQIDELVAPMFFVAPPGQKLGYIVEDMVWQNIYATTETDIETLEAMFIEKDEVWQEDVAKRTRFVPLEVELDRMDYWRVLREFGIRHEVARAETECKSDLISFPHGSYKVMVSDSLIDGRGLMATANIATGEVIAPARIDGKRTPAGRYTNHSPNPNAEFVVRQNGDLDLVAILAIQGNTGGRAGQEITIDYRQALNMRKQLCQQQSQEQ